MMDTTTEHPSGEIILLEAEPARSERADAQANRARILSAAQQLFAEKGVEQVNMAEIGRAAGIGQGTLYRRFANKAAICQALFDTQMREFQDETLQQLRSMNEAHTTRVTQLRWFLEAVVRFQEQRLPMMRTIFSAGPIPAGFEPPVQWWARRTIAGLLSSAQRHGEIDPAVDIDYFVEALLVLLHPFTLYNQRTHQGFSKERITAGLARIVKAIVQ